MSEQIADEQSDKAAQVAEHVIDKALDLRGEHKSVSLRAEKEEAVEMRSKEVYKAASQLAEALEHIEDAKTTLGELFVHRLSSKGFELAEPAYAYGERTGRFNRLREGGAESILGKTAFEVLNELMNEMAKTGVSAELTKQSVAQKNDEVVKEAAAHYEANKDIYQNAAVIEADEEGVDVNFGEQGGKPDSSSE